MPIERIFRSASLRLAILQTGLFLLAFAAAGSLALVLVHRAEFRAAHAEIEELEDDASDLIEHGRVADLIRRIDQPQRDPSRVYRLDDASGRRLGGVLPEPAAPRPAIPKFWTVFRAQGLGAPHAAVARVLALVHPEPGGLRLVVGEDLTLRERQDAPLLALACAAAAGVSGLGMIGGVAIAGRTLRRADHLTQVVEAFAAGQRPSPLQAGRSGGSELDDLARALDAMMERETRLIAGLRQTSTAIAHDLRRPLARHNQIIAEVLARPASPPQLRDALGEASGRIDEVLATFQSLLHIAELEAGAPGLALQSVELNDVAAQIVDAYTPMAEAGGRSLQVFPAAAPAQIMGEPRTLGRLVANLVENALTHTPPGSRVEVRIDATGPCLCVSDNGPGVPEAARERIFERFFRLDASRSTPGSGLGLALAAATARAFGGRLSAHDAQPGLRVCADFRGAARSRGSHASVT